MHAQAERSVPHSVSQHGDYYINNAVAHDAPFEYTPVITSKYKIGLLNTRD
jgi:hypothetical protein